MRVRNMSASVKGAILMSAVAAVGVAGMAQSAQAAVVAPSANTTIINFGPAGPSDLAGGLDAGGRTYNTFGGPTVTTTTGTPTIVSPAVAAPLKNTTGAVTAVTLTLSNPLTGTVGAGNLLGSSSLTQFTPTGGSQTTQSYTAGFNTDNVSGGTALPTGTAAALGYSGSVTKSSGYGNTTFYPGSATNQVPSVLLTLSGLDPTKTYNFDIFASRGADAGAVTDVRSADYTITGSGVGTLLKLDAANNTGNVAQTATAIAPTAGGVITIVASPDSTNTNSNGFFYTGIVEVDTVVPEPGSLAGLSLMALTALRRRRA